MVQGITQWLWQCVTSPVALPVVTAFSLLMVPVPAAQALDEGDLQRLIETNECPGCDLQAADLRRLDLSGANLEGANLKKANFFYAVLDGANLSGADLSSTNLSYVSALTLISDLTNSSGQPIEIPAKFIGADLTGALLNYGDFSGADMTEANFFEAFIDKTQFVGSQLQRTNFASTFVHDIDLRGANLCGSTYWGGNDYRRSCDVPVTDLNE
ncbi:pentapeptide repeat-containing protein [Leptothoe spongobia]|uniref:Pentapeptide repeat-containing protein n=1 Tax=Leptothoe spongobia TAU-MAC 1115 TaxID=1967444 RepID=A0A947DER2_9CYAN|nr:pentapeptide repeat-containing protein [Leptothoe spongobia]MBT9315683.1 pentapeptide repeat-containing protein [Leptothoe spongobia TAU-MAC 1115]